jgi:hypothetical protein
MLEARLAVLAVVVVELPVFSEVEPRGRETMVAGALSLVAMTVLLAEAEKTRSVAMPPEGLRVLVVLENQVVSAARLPITLVVAVAVVSLLAELAEQAVVELAEEVRVRTVVMLLQILVVAVVVLVEFLVQVVLEVLALSL